MPTYEFTCTGCGQRSELRASIAEKEAGLRPPCPACGSRELRQALSTVAVIGGGGGEPAEAGGGCCAAGCACGKN